MEFIYFDCIDSTNAAAMAMVREGAKHGTCLIAKRQASGRGRLGRTFISPEGGLYLSLILRPGEISVPSPAASAPESVPSPAAPAASAASAPEISNARDLTGVTTETAVVVCRAIESLLQEKQAFDPQDAPKIKWVNDIYMHGRKICGILVQAITQTSGAVDALVIGIGVNVAVKEQDFPEDVRSLAASVFQDSAAQASPAFTPQELGERIAAGLMELTFRPSAFMEEYRKRCFVIGQRVRFQSPDHQETLPLSGRVLDVCEDGALLVRMDSGEIRALFTGEVSLIPIGTEEDL